MATRGKSARIKGHTFEREMMQFFKDLGFVNCKTSRNESKSRDDLKVDLCFTEPFNIQCKAMDSIQPSPHTIIFKEMPKEKKHNLLFWKRSNKGVLVCMSLEDFKLLFENFMQGWLCKD